MAGRIGIFWYHDERILASTCEVSEGAAAAGSVDSEFTHIDQWLRHQLRHPALRSLRYEQLPRGRVIYKIETKAFVVLMDKVLFTPEIEGEILAAFDLTQPTTRFETDPHYTTEADDLNRLLS